MDDIVQRCAIRNLKNTKNRTYIKEKVIRRVYGFHYDDDFRGMLMKTVGMICLERLESRIDQKKFDVMKAALGALKDYRNKEAHTHLKGVTTTLAAPSLTKQKFLQVYEGLKDLELELRRLKK